MPLVDILCYISEKTGCQLRTGEDWAISKTDAQTAVALNRALRSGQVVHDNGTMSIRLDKAGVILVRDKVASGCTFTFTSVTDNQEVELLGTRIALGPAKSQLSCRAEMAANDLDAILAGMEAEETRELQFVDVRGVTEYSRWIGKRHDEAVPGRRQASDTGR